MKKMLLLLASLACLGFLASCSNDDTQDVYVTNLGNYEAAGIMTGTMTVIGDSSTYKIDNTRYAFVSSYSTNKDVVSYEVTVPYTETYGSNTYNRTEEVTVKKIDGKYYYNTIKIDEPLEVEGSLDGDFTVKSIKIGNYTTITDLKFTRK